MSRISDLSLFEEFSVRGRWWLPAREAESVAGEVTFSSSGITLDLDGKFDVKELQETAAIFGGAFRAPTILGETIEGEFCMLLSTFAIRVNWNTCSFAAHRLLIGERPFGEYQSRVSRVLVDLTHLEDWSSVQLIRTGPGNSGTFNITVPTERVELFSLDGSHGFKMLTLFAGTTTQSKPGGRCTVRFIATSMPVSRQISLS
jgi:hypothetical protein